MLASCLELSITVMPGSASRSCRCFGVLSTWFGAFNCIIVSIFFLILNVLLMCVTFLKPTFFYYIKFLLFHSSFSFLHQPVKSSAKQCKSEMKRMWVWGFQLCYRNLVGLAAQVTFPYSELSTLRQWATALCNEYSLLQVIVMGALFCNFAVFWSSRLFSY